MEALRGLYMGVLAALLILAGCLGGGVIDDTEGQDSGTNNNQPPLIYATNDEGYVWVFSAVDLDGDVTDMGLDTDLDGIVDEYLTGDFSTPTKYVFGTNVNGTIQSPYLLESITNGSASDNCVARMNIIAIDDDGASAIIPLQEWNLPCSGAGSGM